MDNKEYIINEYKTKWTVKVQNGKVTASYNFPKSDFETVDALKEYLAKNDI